ncbi:O-antigen polymerase [Fredinandcohnia humi]
MLYILIWLIVLAISVSLFKKVSGSLSILQPNLNSIIFYYSLFFSSFIGSLLIVLDVDDYYMINKLTDDNYRLIGFLVICFTMVFLPLTMYILSKLVGFDAKVEYQSYLKKPVETIFNVKTEFYFLFAGLSAVSMLACAYTLLKTGQIPLVELLTNPSADLGKLRIDAARHFNGNVLIRNIFAIALTPLLSLIAYVYSVKTNMTRWKILFLGLFACSVVISIYDLAKSPIFFYVIMFLLVRIYIGKTKFTPLKIFVLGTLGASLLVVMYVFIQDVTNLESYLSYNSGPIGRVIFAQIAPTFLHLNIFGDALPFLNGRGLPSVFLDLFGVEQVRSARLVMEVAFPQRIEEGTGGVLNTLYVAEAYANFGYVGIVIGTIYIGLIIQVLYIAFLRLPKNPVFISLFIYFSINIPRTLVGGFTDFLFNIIWFIVVFLMVGMILFIRFRIDLFSLFRNRKLRENVK